MKIMAPIQQSQAAETGPSSTRVLSRRRHDEWRRLATIAAFQSLI